MKLNHCFLLKLSNLPNYRLMEIWKLMYKCHKVQNHISRQLNHLTDSLSMDLITESHRQATAQLETEVSFWYHSFCNLIKSQQEYVRTLCRWIQLTSCLADDHRQSRCSSAVCRLCEEWQLGFEKLPDKVNLPYDPHIRDISHKQYAIV